MCRGLVPEIRLSAKYEARIAGKAVSNFMAELEGHPVGFVVGFPEEDLFYIYLFGVAPQHRNRGIGQQLLDHTEHWARANGYNGISLQSRNKFPDMLRLLIKNRYNIVSFEDRGDCYSSPIRFQKLFDS